MKKARYSSGLFAMRSLLRPGWLNLAHVQACAASSGISKASTPYSAAKPTKRADGCNKDHVQRCRRTVRSKASSRASTEESKRCKAAASTSTCATPPFFTCANCFLSCACKGCKSDSAFACPMASGKVRQQIIMVDTVQTLFVYLPALFLFCASSRLIRPSMPLELMI